MRSNDQENVIAPWIPITIHLVGIAVLVFAYYMVPATASHGPEAGGGFKGLAFVVALGLTFVATVINATLGVGTSIISKDELRWAATGFMLLIAVMVCIANVAMLLFIILGPAI
jgi:hypothetical protein